MSGRRGIDDGYEDCEGRWRPISPETRAALEQAMGGEPPDEIPVRVIAAGECGEIQGPGELRYEDGGVFRLKRFAPPVLPPGYHELHRPDGRVERLIATPRRCALDERMRAWGWTAQLYAVRSRRSWGIGDLADLRELASWSARELGAQFLVMNPIFAATPGGAQQASPYFPGSRRFRDPLYLRVEEVPGAREALPRLERFSEAGRALNARRRIDRDRAREMKMGALETLWEGFSGDRGFDRYRAREGEALREFAVFCALAERLGREWRGWRQYRKPRSAAVTRFAEEHAGRVRFYEWLQWLLDRQLAEAARELDLVQDLPVGSDPDGPDAWVWQEFLAEGVTVGAPPDPYSAKGQDWGLPPFIPHRLRAAAYRPFIETLRAAMRHAGGLRIDHAMGLFRLFWIPRGASPEEGAYVRYPASDLLDIVALESHRAGVFVIGEDLGTVEQGVREELAARRILSTRLMWFEEALPLKYPERALASVTTHDLPTVAGIWTGADLAERKALGLEVDESGARELRERVAAMTGLPPDAGSREAVRRVHALLARAPSVAVSATLEDAVGVVERPNIPSTGAERPNWSLALPKTLEEIRGDPQVREVAAAIRTHRHAQTTISDRR